MPCEQLLLNGKSIMIYTEKEWLGYKHKFDLFTKDSEGNYIKRAKTNKKGELELL